MNPKCDHRDKNGSFLYTYVVGVGWSERFCKHCGYREELVDPSLQNSMFLNWKEKVPPPEFLEAIRIIIEL